MAPNYQSMLPLFQDRRERDKLFERQERHSNDDTDNEKNNTNHNDNGSFSDVLGNQLSKRPILIFSIMFILACTVGHTLTVIYYWDDLKYHPVSVATATASIQSSNIDQVQTKKSEMKKLQSFAKKQKMKGLDEPSLKSEMYYNKTLSMILSKSEEDSDFPILGNPKSTRSTSIGDMSVPPPRPPPQNCQSTIAIIRHCEKGDIREHCNLLGFERSQYIATLFGNGDEKWPAPSRIYAHTPGGRKNDLVQNWREIETVQPLSTKINVPINDDYGMYNKDEFANELFSFLRSGEGCGNVALVSWKHDDIPDLANLLGCGPKDGCPTDFDSMDFDSVWQLRYTYKKQQYSPYPEAEKNVNYRKPWGLHPEWWIFGKVEKENFDPLAYSKNIE